LRFPYKYLPARDFTSTSNEILKSLVTGLPLILQVQLGAIKEAAKSYVLAALLSGVFNFPVVVGYCFTILCTAVYWSDLKEMK